MNFLILHSLRITAISAFCVVITLFSAIGDVLASDVEQDIGHDCLIEPFVITDVGSSTQGIVAQLLVDRGSVVKKGQPIAQLASGMEQVTTEQAIARAEMRGEVVTRKADLELAQLDSKRFWSLHKKGLAPAQQRDEAVAREKISHAALEQARENQMLALLELKRTVRALQQRTIKSPVDGVIVKQLVFPGELVFDNPIMTVAQLNPLRVEVVLPARLFGTIKAGDMAQVHPEIETEKSLIARVDVVDPLLDSRSGTFGVRLLLPNADFTVPAGQKCRVNFHTGQDDDVVPVDQPAGVVVEESDSLGAALPEDSD